MLGERLKQIRIDKGLSQKAIADILGTSSGYISEIEQGKKMPGSDFLISLKRELGVSLDWLLMGVVGEQQLAVMGKRIEQYRMGLRYKPGEFAKIIGIKKDYLRDIENQETIPSNDVIEAIIKNTDINPQWLQTGEGSMRNLDYRTGDGRPFNQYLGFDQGEIDHELMWEVVNNIQHILMKNGKDPQAFSSDKRTVIQDLLYADAMQKDRQIDLEFAEILFSLTYCEVCEKNLSKKRWQEKWGIKTEPGTNLEDVLILVKAAPGIKVPIEGFYKEHISEHTPGFVHCTDWYRRQVDDGSLIIVDPNGNKTPTP